MICSRYLYSLICQSMSQCTPSLGVQASSACFTDNNDRDRDSQSGCPVYEVHDYYFLIRCHMHYVKASLMSNNRNIHDRDTAVSSNTLRDSVIKMLKIYQRGKITDTRLRFSRRWPPLYELSQPAFVYGADVYSQARMFTVRPACLQLGPQPRGSRGRGTKSPPLTA